MNSPEEAVQSLLKECSFSQACVGYLTAALSWVLFFNILDGVSFPVLLLKICVVFAAEITVGYFLASFCGLFFDFLHVETSPAKLFVLLGAAGYIKSLLIAFALISAVIPVAHLGWLAPLALFLVFALQLGFLTRGVKRAYHVSYAKSFFAWIFAGVPILVAFGLLLTFFIWGISLLL